MEKQELRTTEQVKYETIKAIVNNNLSKENASISLNPVFGSFTPQNLGFKWF